MPRGPWPLPRPCDASGPVALWWSGGIEALAARALILHAGETEPLLLLTSEAYGLNEGVAAVNFAPVQRWDEPGGWGPALTATETAGCQTLLIPAYRASSPDGHTWHQVAGIMASRGAHLWLPFLHMSELEVARLADFLGVPWRESWACAAALACQTCAVCLQKQRLMRLLGRKLSV